MAQPREHREWFQPLSTNRKSCPTCKTKFPPGETAHAWGEYAHAKWHTVKHFCRACFDAEVRRPLLAHAGPCGCTITLCARSGHGPLPDWLTLEEVSCPAG